MSVYGMKTARSSTVAAVVGLVLAAVGVSSGSAAPGSKDFTVGVRAVPGVDTGLVLADGQSITVTAVGMVCPWGTSVCVGPDGDSSVIATSDGFLLPGVPAWGLVGRVGSGPWVQVGSGPTTLSGSGDLVFAVNDNEFDDNTGGFTVTVSYSCWPGYGHGDTFHSHSGPPPKNPSGCYPGHGYGDSNHDHNGPPGHLTSPSTPAAPSATGGPSGEHGNSTANGNSHSRGKGQP